MRLRRMPSPIGWGLLALVTGLAGLWGLANEGGGRADDASIAADGSGTSSSTSSGTLGSTSTRPTASATSATSAATSTSTTPTTTAPTGGSAAEVAAALTALCASDPPLRLIPFGEVATREEIRAAARTRLDTVAVHQAAVAALVVPEELEPARVEMAAHLGAARALLIPNAELPEGEVLDSASEPYVRASTADNEMGRYAVAAGLLGGANCATPVA